VVHIKNLVFGKEAMERCVIIPFQKIRTSLKAILIMKKFGKYLNLIIKFISNPLMNCSFIVIIQLKK
jgi:hypothetical protein